MSSRIESAMAIVKMLYRLGEAIAAAVDRDDLDGVDEILSDELKTVLAMKLAEAEARAHFGGE